MSGPIPQIGRLSGVASIIDFSSNQLDGDIPSSFSNCLSLENLFLTRNQLSGSIPKALGEVRGLETLNLSSNQLSGTIPVELQNLQVLRLLNFSYNDLEGDIPSGGVFQNLSAVHLEGNGNLCLQAPCVNRGEGRRNIRHYIIVAVSVALALCLTIGSILYIKIRKVKVSSSSSSSEQLASCTNDLL